jgi:hypothetical protein
MFPIEAFTITPGVEKVIPPEDRIKTSIRGSPPACVITGFIDGEISAVGRATSRFKMGSNLSTDWPDETLGIKKTTKASRVTIRDMQVNSRGVKKLRNDKAKNAPGL